MKYLVTGGAGFIGSNLAEILLKQENHVVILDNFSTGLRSNIQELWSLPGILEVIEGDLCDLDVCHKACHGVDYVLHQAALGSVPRSVANPLATNDSNVTGTLNVFMAARDQHVKRIVFASSSSVYGNSETLPKVETMPTNPISPYAASKLACEIYSKVFYEIYGIEIIGLRYFNVFGKRQDPHSTYAAVIPIFVKALLSDVSPNVFGDGEQTRDFTFVDNVVHANLLACQADASACGKMYNIACGKRISLNALYNKLCELFGKNIAPEFIPPRTGDVKHSLADISLANQYLKYTPLFDVYTGLEKAIGWYKENLLVELNE